MKKLRQILLLIIIILVLSSCSKQISYNAYDKLIISLEGTGYTVEAKDAEESIYMGERKWLTVDETDNISVYIYESNEKMEKDASYISEDGFTYDNGKQATITDWVSYPHFYKSDNIIVLYVGDNSEINNALEEIIGPQFAGETYRQEEKILEKQPNVIIVGYNAEDKEAIFGDMSLEEIGIITEIISKEVSLVESNQDNINSIIENAFKESGINDAVRLETAKSKLIISKNKQLVITYDITKEKEIFGELSKEEIADILTDIANEVYEDENYNDNFHSIIEKVFKNYGIDDSLKLNSARSYIRAIY